MMAKYNEPAFGSGGVFRRQRMLLELIEMSVVACLGSPLSSESNERVSGLGSRPERKKGEGERAREREGERAGEAQWGRVSELGLEDHS